MREFRVSRAYLKSKSLKKKTFLKSIILNEKVFLKSIILNEKVFVKSMILNFFVLSVFELKFSQRVRF